MKLYLSGGIANVADYEEIFARYERILVSAGYEVVNPLQVEACMPQVDQWGGELISAPCLHNGEPGSPGDPHSWACYLRYDLIEMLKCDGVAIILETFWNSKGAHLEEYVAMQCALPRATVQEWLDKVAIQQLDSELDSDTSNL